MQWLNYSFTFVGGSSKRPVLIYQGVFEIIEFSLHDKHRLGNTT